MSKVFFPKLAANNMKKNSKMYIPYLITCIGTVLMFYIMYALSYNTGLGEMSGGMQLQSVLLLGNNVIAIFAVIFLFYTSSFLMKRRKKEFGVFNILGMEKKHIGRMMMWESLYTAVISLVVGLGIGIVINKLVFLALLKLLHFEVPITFEISGRAVVATLILFSCVFLLIFLNTLRQIHLAKPVELLRSGESGEKEPKTKWLLAVLGLLCLGGGYFISVTTKSPMDSLPLFFLAVILVIIGTYCLFTASSIAVLKLLRRKKSYYYKSNHFISVSGMIYRMKQNAVGLANICILSTMVLVMISTTFSLYIGMEDLLRNRFPRNLQLTAQSMTAQQAEEMDEIILAEAKKIGANVDNVLRYRYINFTVQQDGNNIASLGFDANTTYGGSSAFCNVVCIPLKEYNRMEGQNKILLPGEVLLYEVHGSIPGEEIHIADKVFRVKERLQNMEIATSQLAMMMDTYYIVVPEEADITDIYHCLADNSQPMPQLIYSYGFDTTVSSDNQIKLCASLRNTLKQMEITGQVESVEQSKESFFALYGGFFFLGIFLGLLFIMATVLIMYYKQISEGYEDKRRFEIMQKVGISRQEIKSSIRSQVLIVFFLPLVVAALHIVFAFPIITKLLALFNMTNTSLFMWGCIVTFAVFALFYAIVYTLTARVYYKIVS